MRRLSCVSLWSLASSASLLRLWHFRNSSVFVIRNHRLFSLDDSFQFADEASLIVTLNLLLRCFMTQGRGQGQGQGQEGTKFIWTPRGKQVLEAPEGDAHLNRKRGGRTCEDDGSKGQGAPSARPCESKRDVIEGLQEDHKGTRVRGRRSW